ncbi:MAG: bacillithiol biosynthesis cysteine-adding enzyme BshC [Candidatus Hydrogenedentes bacterium]|nr:bacillithiol biosynthesis cysteine-adding enzyme BshC [Candidatus Hydrogenedentota bacterium]
MPVRSVAAAYRNEEADLLPFYAAWPRELLTNRLVTGECWPGLAQELAAYQSSIGNPPPDLGESFIVTGQQPALFTGPLYTVYKIATAIRLARQISDKHGIRCTPVFWQGSDDHDFEEAHSATVLTKNHEPMTLTYNPMHDVAGLSMYRVPLDASVHDLVDRAADATPGSEYREEVRAFLHDSLSAASSLADWSARIIARLFAGSGLVIFTSECQSARKAARDIIEKEIREPLISTRLVNEAGTQLAALGYERQVSKGETDCGFFLDVHNRRCKVTYQDGMFHAPSVELRFTQDQLLGVLEEEPERFSPNVALRTVVQQRLFPTAAYVAGPGEIAYWGQFKPLFDLFNLQMPVVYPRAQCALTTSKLNKLKNKLGLDGASTDWTSPDDLITQAMRSGASNPLVAAFQSRRASVELEMKALEAELAKAPVPAPTLTERVVTAFDNYERMLLRADETRYETVKQQVTRLCNTFSPFRKPQERVYTIVSFLFEHGWDLVPRIVREIEIERFELNEIEL